MRNTVLLNTALLLFLMGTEVFAFQLPSLLGRLPFNSLKERDSVLLKRASRERRIAHRPFLSAIRGDIEGVKSDQHPVEAQTTSTTILRGIDDIKEDEWNACAR